METLKRGLTGDAIIQGPAIGASDRSKFHPTDEHLIEENKEEVDQIHRSDKTGPVSKQDRDKFAEIDRDSETKE